jgi:hypothetical protein
MKRSYLIFAVTLAVAVFVSFGWPQHGSAAGRYKITKTAKVGGNGVSTMCMPTSQGGGLFHAADLLRAVYVGRHGCLLKHHERFFRGCSFAEFLGLMLTAREDRRVEDRGPFENAIAFMARPSLRKLLRARATRDLGMFPVTQGALEAIRRARYALSKKLSLARGRLDLSSLPVPCLCKQTFARAALDTFR